MTLLVDIECPDCGRTGPVRKRDLGRYYCAACDRTFSESAVPRVPHLGLPEDDGSESVEGDDDSGSVPADDDSGSVPTDDESE